MARCLLKPGTDIGRLKKELKRIGFTLRCYKGAGGACSYRLHRNAYAQEVDIMELLEMLQGL